MEEYLNSKNIGTVLKDVVLQLVKDRPEKPIQYIIQRLSETWLPEEMKKYEDKSNTPAPTFVVEKPASDGDEELSEDETTETPSATRMELSPLVNAKRRGAISSEPFNPSARYEKRVIPKTKESQGRLEIALKKNILFRHLEEDERLSIFDAMAEVIVQAGTTIIRQGDEGDNFYVLDEGEVDVFVSRDGAEMKYVCTIGKDGSFGELALIYGCPRAATVKAKSNCHLWALDRTSYRQILMAATMQKHNMYENFLEKVPILQSMTKWEKLTVADALEPFNFEDGQVIMKEGEPGDMFYLITEGHAKVLQKRGTHETEVGHLGRSNYFGEIALLTNRPRAATVVAVGKLKCVGLDRARFTRVLGPCEEILRRNIEAYNQYMTTKL